MPKENKVLELWAGRKGRFTKKPFTSDMGGQHAEVVMFSDINFSSGPDFECTMDAWPCPNCHKLLIQKSEGRTITLEITADFHGGYAASHGFGAGTKGRIIYAFGNVTYVNIHGPTGPVVQKSDYAAVTEATNAAERAKLASAAAPTTAHVGKKVGGKGTKKTGGGKG